MKALLMLLACLPLLSFSQTDKNLTRIYWSTGKEKVVYGHGVLRIKGFNANASNVTNIGYQTKEQLSVQYKQTAEKQMWTEDKLNSMLDLINNNYKGGRLALYIQRGTIAAANTEYFTIIVKTKNEEEIFRKELESNTPNSHISGSRYGGNYWWNFGETSIRKAIEIPFYIYVVDKLHSEIYKFEIKS